MKQILFVELLGGIGDVLIALSAIQALGRSHPQAKLTVLTFAPGGELLETDPLIHRVVFADKGQARAAIEQLLSQQRFDLIVSDTNYDSIDRVLQASGAAHTVTNLWRSPPPNQLVSDRFLQILLTENLITSDAIHSPTIHLLEREQQEAHEKLSEPARPLIALYSDAGMQVKRWATENFIALGQRLQKRFGGTIVIPIGANPEQASEIADAIGHHTLTWQQGTLREFAALMSHMNLVIAPDTGPARIAAARNVPTITLFGPSWHERYGQPQPHQNLQGYPECVERVIQNFTEQRCWYGGVCPFDQWHTCLEAISVDRVMTAAIAVLKAQSHSVLK